MSAITKQLKFYFSDSNLSYDKFLSTEIQNSSDGWVSLPTILSFNRMKQLGADLPTTLESLEQSDFFDVDAENQKIRRKVPYIPGMGGNNTEKTLHIRGFPTTVTLSDLEEFFNGAKLETGCIRMRRDVKNKEFIGKVFVEFQSVSDAQQVLDSGLSYQETPLEIEFKQEWLSRHAKKTNSSSEASAAELRESITVEHVVKLSGLKNAVSYQGVKVIVYILYPSLSPIVIF